jgi:DNA mismatch endonuclease (patch repair protein)
VTETETVVVHRLAKDGGCRPFGIEMESSQCCRLPNLNRDFWIAKIRINKERDKKEQSKLAEMGWHCITVWECELTPKRRDITLESISFTLNHIWLQDHKAMT